MKTINRTNALGFAAIGIIVSVIAGTSSAALAADPQPTVGSAGTYFLVDNATGAPVIDGTVNAWDAELAGSPTPDNSTFDQVFVGPADATSVETFIAPRGSETTPSAWAAWAPSAFVPGTKNVLMPTANLSTQTAGNALGVKASGGDFSLGIAFLKNNGLTVASSTVYYSWITVEAGTGAWHTYPQGDPPPPGEDNFGTTLRVTVGSCEDGALNLVAPTALTVPIGNPQLDPVTHLSTSTGTLGQFSVDDGRVCTHPGWTLTTSVDDFAKEGDATTTIDKKQLGVAPVLVSQPAGAGVTLAPAQVAGTAIYAAPFAESGSTGSAGTSTFNADLTFVAPPTLPDGTLRQAAVYDSTLTITLASK